MRPGFNSWVRKIPWRRKWQSTPALLPGKSHGWRNLIGYSPWGRKESDTTERLHFQHPGMSSALGSITTNKASGGDGIPTELFQILKDDPVKVLHSVCQQMWKTQQWLQDWKGQFSFQSQRKEMPKNVQTTTQLHSSHTLVTC